MAVFVNVSDSPVNRFSVEFVQREYRRWMYRSQGLSMSSTTIADVTPGSSVGVISMERHSSFGTTYIIVRLLAGDRTFVVHCLVLARS